MHRAWLVASGAVACVLLVAGCGDGAPAASEADFSAKYTSASQGFKTRMAAAQSDAKAAVATQSLESETRVFTAMQKITDETLSELKPLRAPSPYADDFDAVRSALAAQRDALRHVLAAAKGSDSAGLSAALQSYAAALTTWQTSATRLDSSLGTGPARAGPQT